MRAQYNTLTIPFIMKNVPLFCVLKRADSKIWQFVAGGGENDELHKEAAVRELEEEVGLKNSSWNDLSELDAVGSVASHFFAEFEES